MNINENADTPNDDQLRYIEALASFVRSFLLMRCVYQFDEAVQYMNGLLALDPSQLEELHALNGGVILAGIEEADQGKRDAMYLVKATDHYLQQLVFMSGKWPEGVGETLIRALRMAPDGV